MCTLTLWKRPKRAKHDIVYGRISGDVFVSGIKKFEYDMGKIYKTRMRAVARGGCPADSVDSTWFNHLSSENVIRFIGPGFHACLTVPRAQKNSIDHGMVLCTVPAGSLYYEDGTGLIVANKIVVDRKIDLP